MFLKKNMMRKKKGFKKFLELNGLSVFFLQKFYKGSINIKLDIYKCPFLKKIMKYIFLKKTHINICIITRPFKGSNLFYAKKGLQKSI